MASNFNLPANATKKVLIEKYNALLSAYEAKVRSAREAAAQAPAAGKRADAEALVAASDTSVGGVLTSIGALRGQVGSALGELTDKLAAQAERSLQLERAIELREKRLAELYEIEEAADALDKVADAWVQRREAAEAEFVARVAELEHEIGERRSAWVAEKTATEKRRAQEQAEGKQARQREETEYTYQRDRQRRLDQDQYEEQAAQLAKELAAAKSEAEAEMSTREARLGEAEAELDDLRGQVATFEQGVGQAVKAAVSAERKALGKDHEQQVALVALEREWENKMAHQKQAHLEALIAAQDTKLAAMSEELAATQRQVREIAEKAIEGASQGRAFSSVQQIALEQARKSDAAPRSS